MAIIGILNILLIFLIKSLGFFMIKKETHRVFILKT